MSEGEATPYNALVTTALGIAGAFVATYLGQALGWYHAGEGAGLIGAVVGAVIVLVVWGFFNRLLHIPKRTTVPILNWKPVHVFRLGEVASWGGQYPGI